MDEFKAITVFARAADARTFHQAAIDLGISPQAVSKMIKQLEHQLGVRLFHRTTRQTSLTAEGRSFLESVQPGLDMISGAMSQVRTATEAIKGPVRISAALSARKVLLEPLAQFNALYPEVQFDLLLDDSFTDAVVDRIDVGFRSGAQPGGNLIARRLFGVQQIVCASPGYIAQYGAPQSLAALGQHRCTGFRNVATGRLQPWELMVDGELRRLNMPASFCSNDVEGEMAAVMAGVGIGLIDSINAAAEIRAGRLMPLLTEHHSDNLAFSMYYPQRVPMPRRLRAFIDFMLQALGDSKMFRLEMAELKAPALKRRKRVVA
jgi:DNA-binding transcriptional LysR family regulator